LFDDLHQRKEQEFQILLSDCLSSALFIAASAM